MATISAEPNWTELSDAASRLQPLRLIGRVAQVIGLTIESLGPPIEVGELCRLCLRSGAGGLLAEVVGFRDDRVLLMPLGEMNGVGPGTPVVTVGRPLTIGVGRGLCGRVLDGLGNPIDGLGPLAIDARYPVHASPPRPLSRQRIRQPLAVGVRAIDALFTCGKGQRIGIFSGSGVGKSVMLGMIANHTAADVIVIALVGERGREVREFVERDLGPEGRKRSVVVAATSDEPALVRIKAAFVATAIAEYYRDQGLDVLLMMDSVTRFAMAQREVGLAVGEPPTTRGYTPSVFSLLPRLLERAGTAETGSITAFYSVLVDGDDMMEPITDAVRGIVDGHVALSRELAARNHYPAVDVNASISRLMPDIADARHQAAAAWARSMVAAYREAEDLINIGAYVPGSNPRIDAARAAIGDIERFLRQAKGEPSEFGHTRSGLIELAQAHNGLVEADDDEQ